MSSLGDKRFDSEIKDAFRSAVDDAEASIDVTSRLAEFTGRSSGGWFFLPRTTNAPDRRFLTLGGIAVVSAVVTVLAAAYFIIPSPLPNDSASQRIAAGEQQTEDIANNSENFQGRSENGESNAGRTDYSKSGNSTDSGDPESQSETSDKAKDPAGISSGQVAEGSELGTGDDSGLSPTDQPDIDETSDSGSGASPAAPISGPVSATPSDLGNATDRSDTDADRQNSAGSQLGTTSTQGQTAEPTSTLSLRTSTSSPRTTRTTTRRTVTEPSPTQRTSLPSAFRDVAPTPPATESQQREATSTTDAGQRSTTEPSTTAGSTSVATTAPTTEPVTCSFTIGGGSVSEATTAIRAAGCNGPISLVPPNATGSLARVVGGMTQTINEDEPITLIGFAQVPDVEGLSAAAAAATLKAASFTAVAESEYVADDDPRIGTVIDQSPRRRTRQEAQSVVRYTVALANPAS